LQNAETRRNQCALKRRSCFHRTKGLEQENSIIKTLTELTKPYEVISIVGNAKNAGKTTVLNAIIELYRNQPIAITSIGLDGELIDNVTSLPKPRIYVYEGMIVATAEECLKVTEASFVIIGDTDIQSALGIIKIIRIVRAGNCLVGGPSTVLAMEKLVSRIKVLKVAKILIDGAFSRKAISKTSDACIYAVGAVMSPSMDQVVSAAALTIRQFALPKVAKELEYLDQMNQITLIDDQGHNKVLEWDSALMNPESIFESIDSNTEYLYIPGSLSSIFAKEFIKRRKSSMPDIILRSPTHLILPESIMTQLFQTGKRIFVLHPINLIAIAYNPFSPTGYEFDELTFRHRLLEITTLPLMNVLHESEEDHE